MTPSRLSLRKIRARAVNAPMKRPLRTSVGEVATAPLVLIDIETNEGIVGHAYLFAYVNTVSTLLQRLLHDLSEHLEGALIAPLEIQARAATRFNLLGARGLVGLALSGIDVACWDVLAKAAELPLAQLLGGELRPIPAYNSTGLGLMPPEEAADEAVELLAAGFEAVKLRLGHSTLDADLQVVRTVRKRIPGGAILMSDYNHALSIAEALKRGGALDSEGLYWIEEPTTHDDFAGHARIARELRTPIQIGENFTSIPEMVAALTQGACDYVMPDLERIGGISGWMKAAAIAEAAGIEMSSHLFAEVSAHLLAVTPTRHWLEYVDWADAILQEPLSVTAGHITASPRPGVGLAWNEDAIRHFLVES